MLLEVLLAASSLLLGGSTTKDISLQCRPTGGVNEKVDLIEFDINEDDRSFVMRMYMEDKAGQPLLMNGLATVTATRIDLINAPEEGQFKTTVDLDRKTGRYSLRSIHENTLSMVVSTGLCSPSSGNAI